MAKIVKLNNVRYLKTVVNPSELNDSFAEIAFVGRSNVGKSSILNSVCGRKNLARISQVPGKTRTINVYEVVHGRWVVDLPGYGFAVGPEEERAKWKEMIEGYLTGRKNLRMVFLLIDAMVGPTKLDEQMVLWLQSLNLPFSIVANKIDRIKSAQQDNQRREVALKLGFRPDDIFWISAKKGNGVSNLERSISVLLG